MERLSDPFAEHLRHVCASLPAYELKSGEPLLPLPEVEKITSVKKSTLYAYMEQGLFPKCVRLPGGRSVRWPSSRVDAWVRAVTAWGDSQSDSNQLAGDGQ